MPLTGSEIKKQVAQGRIIIDPYDEAQVNPNSYNVRLGRNHHREVFRVKSDVPFLLIQILLTCGMALGIVVEDVFVGEQFLGHPGAVRAIDLH